MSDRFGTKSLRTALAALLVLGSSGAFVAACEDEDDLDDEMEEEIEDLGEEAEEELEEADDELEDTYEDEDEDPLHR